MQGGQRTRIHLPTHTQENNVITWFLVVFLNLADFAYSVSWQFTSHPSSNAFSLDRVEGTIY